MSGLRPGDTSSEDHSHLDATETELVRALVKGDRCAARAAFRKLVEADHCSICTGLHGAHPFWCPLKHVVPASVLAPGVRPSDTSSALSEAAERFVKAADAPVYETRHVDPDYVSAHDALRRLLTKGKSDAEDDGGVRRVQEGDRGSRSGAAYRCGSDHSQEGRGLHASADGGDARRVRIVREETDRDRGAPEEAEVSAAPSSPLNDDDDLVPVRLGQPDVEREREGCARVAEGYAASLECHRATAHEIAARIRARRGLCPPNTETTPPPVPPPCPQCEEGIPHRHETRWEKLRPLEACGDLADHILTALDTHDTHRMKHIRQYAERIKRTASQK